MVLLSILLSLILPIDGTPRITSSFGEFRSTHFHAGVDFSTGGKAGIPVHAVADGTIRNVRVTWRGYGKVLYLEHDSTSRSVYAHLERFSDSIEKRIHSVYEQKGPFPDWIDLDPPLNVRAGDIIGYSGETGNGPPHLHFELRSHNQPVNPIRQLGISQPQRVVFSTLQVIPATPSSTVNGTPYPLSTSLPISKPLKVSGPFTLSVTAHHSVSGSRWALNNLTLRIDGTERASIAMETISFDWTGGVSYLFQRSRTGFSPTRYTYWLVSPSDNPLTFMSCPTVYDLPEGVHTIEILSGKATTSFQLQVVPPGDDKPPGTASGLSTLLSHYVLDGRGLPYPGLPARISSDPETVAGMMKPGEPITMIPLSVSHRESLPRPVTLSLSNEIPPLKAPMISPVFEIGPEDLTLSRNLELLFTVRKPADPEKMSAYIWSGREWNILDSHWTDRGLVSKTKIPGRITVIQDMIPPDIRSIRIQGHDIVVKVSDTLSDLNWDAVVARSKSGDESILIYDPDKKEARGPAVRAPFTVTATDNAGNRASRTHP